MYCDAKTQTSFSGTPIFDEILPPESANSRDNTAGWSHFDKTLSFWNAHKSCSGVPATASNCKQSGTRREFFVARTAIRRGLAPSRRSPRKCGFHPDATLLTPRCRVTTTPVLRLRSSRRAAAHVNRRLTPC